MFFVSTQRSHRSNAPSGLQISGELGACDVRMLNFLHELGEIAARGKDIRDRLFGLPTTRESPRSGGTRPSAAD